MALFVLAVGSSSFVFVRPLTAPALASQQFRATRQILRAPVCASCHFIAFASIDDSAGTGLRRVSFGSVLLSQNRGEESNSAPSKTKRKI